MWDKTKPYHSVLRYASFGNTGQYGRSGFLLFITHLPGIRFTRIGLGIALSIGLIPNIRIYRVKKRPVGGKTKRQADLKHWGLDIQAPEGTPIVAADTGIVTYAGPFKRGYLGEPDTLIMMALQIDLSTYIVEPVFGKVYCASLHTGYRLPNGDEDPNGYAWSGYYGNIVLVFYPNWDVTFQYSHLQDFVPGVPCYQSIDSSTQYTEDTVAAWDTIGFVGRTGYNPGNETNGIHVDVMV